MLPLINPDHVCDVCGHIGPWTDSWSWYGSYMDLDNGSQIVKACSDVCKLEAQVLYRRRTYKRGRTIYARS